MPRKNQVASEDDQVTYDSETGEIDALPALRGGSSVSVLSPDARARMLEEDEGSGLSQDPNDNLIPMIGILQTNSPACDVRNPAHIEGAEPGAFLIKNSPIPLVKGSEGIVFVPAALELCWVEWRPRSMGGGWVAKHAYDAQPDDVVAVPDPQKDGKKRLVRKSNRNEIIETAYRYGLLVLPGYSPMGYVLPFVSTGHTIRKGWETRMNAVVAEETGRRAPAWYRAWRLKTQQRTNSSGTWYVPSYEDERLSTDEEYLMARAMFRAHREAQISIDAGQMDDGSGTSGDVPF